MSILMATTNVDVLRDTHTDGDLDTPAASTTTVYEQMACHISKPTGRSTTGRQGQEVINAVLLFPGICTLKAGDRILDNKDVVDGARREYVIIDVIQRHGLGLDHGTANMRFADGNLA